MSTHEEADAMSDAPSPQTPTATEPEIGDGRDAAPDQLSQRVLENPGRRTTGKLDHLIIEAELEADGKNLDNPAVPAPTIFEDVLKELDRRGLEPAWTLEAGE